MNLAGLPPLPIPSDTANLREGPDLHPRCAPLLPLVGVWRGEGQIVYPTIEGPFHFGQQIVFAHDGRPFLSYYAQSWLLDGPGGGVVRPAARELGWWRPQENGALEVLLAHATGVLEIYYGQARGLTSWELVTDAVVRTESAKEVSTAHRLYGLVDRIEVEPAEVSEVAVLASTNAEFSVVAATTPRATKDLAYVDERAMVGQPLQPHISAKLHRVAG